MHSKLTHALAGVAPWVECQAANRQDPGSIPCARAWVAGQVRLLEATDCMEVSLPLSLPHPSIKINK